MARYCSTDHQLTDWKAGHKAECTPAAGAATVTRPAARAAPAAAVVPGVPATLEASVRTIKFPLDRTTTTGASSKKAGGAAAAVSAAEPRGSYPSEPLIDVDGDPSLELFREPTRQDRKLLQCERAPCGGSAGGGGRQTWASSE